MTHTPCMLFAACLLTFIHKLLLQLSEVILLLTRSGKLSPIVTMLAVASSCYDLSIALSFRLCL